MCSTHKTALKHLKILGGKFSTLNSFYVSNVKFYLFIFFKLKSPVTTVCPCIQILRAPATSQCEYKTNAHTQKQNNHIDIIIIVSTTSARKEGDMEPVK